MDDGPTGVTTGATLRQRPTDGRLRSMAAVYRSVGTTAAISSVQYRANVAIEAVMMAAEPVIYLVMWQIVAREQGGDIDGFTTGRFAAYYITFLFVRTFTTAGSPGNWQRVIRDGRMSELLMRPMHPVHQDLATWLGNCSMRSVAGIPISIALVVAFQPDFDTNVVQVAAFVLAVWIALVMGTLFNDTVGFTAFWLVNITAIGGIASLFGTLFSGKLVPPEVMPDWAQTLSWALPFRWMFAFPIETLIGPTSNGEMAHGFGMQLLWLCVIWLLMQLVWRRGVRRYGAVGG
jgi:ABC-2 type transport system permease protein